MKRRHVLIAEDDGNIRTGLVDTLESEGYEVTATFNGREALNQFKQNDFDLIILDLMMPEISGYDVCRQIRKTNSQVPIIMLTAKSEEIDKVVGLELGADDYVTKPFGVRELLARVAAALRRSVANQTDNSQDCPSVFSVGDIEVDVRQYQASVAGRTITLTARELKLLQLFYLHPNEVLTRDTMLNEAWGIDYMGTTRTLDQHIAQLRKKVEVNPAEPRWIHTVHGVGYRYVAEHK